MVNPVSSGGYQAYSYQQATTPAQETPRGGDNRIEPRQAPASDTQRGDTRAFASRDENTTTRRAEPQPPQQVASAERPSNSNDADRGNSLDISV